MGRIFHCSIYLCLAAASITNPRIHELVAFIAYSVLAILVLIDHHQRAKPVPPPSGGEDQQVEGDVDSLDGEPALPEALD